jgi:Uma2 family endonuclease
MAVEYCTDPEYIEYFAGVEHPKVTPRRRHAILQGRLAAIIQQDGARFGQAGPEWRMQLRGPARRTELQPDVSFYSFLRLRPLDDDERELPPIAPDIAVEIRSPGDSLSYLRKKIDTYFAHGSSLVLDVDPLKRTTRVYAAVGSAHTLTATDHFEHPLAPWLKFDLADLFGGLEIPE